MIVIDPGVWGQILLAGVTGIIGIVTLIIRGVISRMRANAARQLEQQRIQNEIALRDAEARAKELEAKAHERVIAAEGEIRSMADNTALLTRLVDHLSESSKRTSHDADQHREGLTRLIQASVESTKTLKDLVLDMTTVKTDIGEHRRVLSLVHEVIAGLPTQFDDKTNPLIDVIATLVKRVDALIDGLDGAKKQLVVDLMTAIRETLIQMQSQAITIPHTPPPEDNP